jgi:acyl-CoA thioesterase-1
MVGVSIPYKVSIVVWYTVGMKWYIIACVLLLILGGAALLFWSTPTITNYPPQNTRIVAFGDSLVEGIGATKGNDFVSVLSRRLNRTIENKGTAGDTTGDGLRRLDEVLERSPGMVLLLLGGNDTLARTPTHETEENLSKIVERLLTQGSVVVLIGVRGGILGGGEREAIYERVAERYGALYVEDILDGIFGHPDRMADTIHPNDAGYALIAERLKDILEKHELVVD